MRFIDLLERNRKLTDGEDKAMIMKYRRKIRCVTQIKMGVNHSFFFFLVILIIKIINSRLKYTCKNHSFSSLYSRIAYQLIHF